MCRWLKETIDSVGAKLQQTHEKMFNILQNTIILLVVICKLDLSVVHDDYKFFLKSFEEKHYRVLFQGLCTIPSWKNNAKSWPDFTSVEELLSKSDIKKYIVDVLTNMHKSTFKPSLPEVLFSIPIFHFAQGVWKPFKDASELLTFDFTTKKAFKYFKETTTEW